jgi:hypothetical protein
MRKVDCEFDLGTKQKQTQLRVAQASRYSRKFEKFILSEV